MSILAFLVLCFIVSFLNWTWSVQVKFGNWLYAYFPNSLLRWFWWSMDEQIYGRSLTRALFEFKRSFKSVSDLNKKK